MYKSGLNIVEENQSLTLVEFNQDRSEWLEQVTFQFHCYPEFLYLWSLIEALETGEVIKQLLKLSLIICQKPQLDLKTLNSLQGFFDKLESINLEEEEQYILAIIYNLLDMTHPTNQLHHPFKQVCSNLEVIQLYILIHLHKEGNFPCMKAYHDLQYRLIKENLILNEDLIENLQVKESIISGQPIQKFQSIKNECLKIDYLINLCQNMQDFQQICEILEQQSNKQLNSLKQADMDFLLYNAYKQQMRYDKVQQLLQKTEPQAVLITQFFDINLLQLKGLYVKLDYNVNVLDDNEQRIFEILAQLEQKCQTIAANLTLILIERKKQKIKLLVYQMDQSRLQIITHNQMRDLVNIFYGVSQIVAHESIKVEQVKQLRFTLQLIASKCEQIFSNDINYQIYISLANYRMKCSEFEEGLLECFNAENICKLYVKEGTFYQSLETTLLIQQSYLELDDFLGGLNYSLSKLQEYQFHKTEIIQQAQEEYKQFKTNLTFLQAAIDHQ